MRCVFYFNVSLTPLQPIRLQRPDAMLGEVDLTVFAAVVDVPDDVLVHMALGHNEVLLDFADET